LTGQLNRTVHAAAEASPSAPTMIQEIEFAPDSALEGAVQSELVSEGQIPC
jgi:hypothetical protein